ncbi:hypothetical protein HOB10_01270 [Candidatus Parcubacteria bacterium]|jgi:hypothetical protein|nr:hypothetical protein [Candidatus Parcubacteria bacterium]
MINPAALNKLPEEVKDVIYGEDIPLNNIKISNKFFLNRVQLDYILELEHKAFLKKISVLDFPKKLEKMEGAGRCDLRKLTLDIAYEILWPLQEYLENVDRLILRLGGKVPRLKRLKRAALQRTVFPEFEAGTVKQMLKKYNNFKDLRLTSRKIVNPEGRTTAPTVDNWIKDYVHFSGAAYHNALQRSKYLTKAPNIAKLSKNELDSLRHFITAYDDNIKIQFELVAGVLRVSEFSEEKPTTKVDIDKLLKKFHKQLNDIEVKMLPADFIMSEANNNLSKVRDILWNAIGLQDKDKVSSCLKVLIEKKALEALLKEDSRFRNILKRFINLRYSHDLGDWLDKNTDHLLARRLFFEMILVDKMHIKDDVTVLAFYLSNLIPGSGQVVYLDQNTGKFKWREIHMADKQLAWISEVVR